MVDIDAETWRRVFDTNVTGAALVTAAAIPHLSASAGKAIYLSSIAGHLTPPWPGLGSYAVSKAALEKLVDAWRAEHPGIGFTRLVVGDCAGGEGDAMTEFNAGWDQKLAMECYPIWLARNYMSGALMAVEDLVEVVNTILRTGASTAMPIVVATSRPRSARRRDRQALPAANRRGARLDGVLAIDLPERETLQHLVECDAALEPRERRAEAEVDAVAEGEVMIDLAVDVEAVGIGEFALVAIRRAVEQQHGAARRNDLPVELHVFDDITRLDR